MIHISFKYNIGDIVTLVKLPGNFDKNRSRLHMYKNLDEFSPKQYKVKGYSFAVLGDGSYEYRYSLHAYNDDWLTYNNWLTEDYLEGEGTRHDKDVCFKSADGDDLNIGDVVYTSLYYGSKRVSESCTFTKKIRVAKLIYSKETIYDPIEKIEGDVLIDTLCPSINGSLNKERSFCNAVLKNVTEQFLCDFVKTCKYYRINPRNEKLSGYKSRKFWLDELGIFDDVCKRYSSRSKKTSEVKEFSKKESSNKNSRNIEEILSGLSDEEKKEMLKLLIKE